MVLLSPKPITPTERAEMDQLCRLMQEEKDTVKLSRLLRHLQELLDRRKTEIVEGGRG